MDRVQIEGELRLPYTDWEREAIAYGIGLAVNEFDGACLRQGDNWNSYEFQENVDGVIAVKFDGNNHQIYNGNKWLAHIQHQGISIKILKLEEY